MSQSTATDEPIAKRSGKMEVPQSGKIDETYYFVSINYPFMSSVLNMESLKTQAKLLRVKDVDGKFVVHFNETANDGTNHRIHIIIFEVEGSQAASGAKAQDFLYSTKNVHTDEILATHLHVH